MENQVILSNDNQQSEKSVIIYKSEDDEVQLEVKIINETVWLTQAQMAQLFGTQRQAITKHLKNIFDCHELDRGSNSSVLELLQKEGNKQRYNFINFVIIATFSQFHRG